MEHEKTALLTSVPTVMLFEGGDVKRVLVGARSAQEYRAGIDELLH
jgi:hypothetical protein